MTALFASIGFTVFAALVLIAGSIVAGAKGRKLGPGERAIEASEMRKHLVWGLIYSNPEDPRGWVPKVRGPGWTVNVRERSTAVLLAFVTIATIAGVLLTVLAAFMLMRSLPR